MDGFNEQSFHYADTDYCVYQLSNNFFTFWHHLCRLSVRYYLLSSYSEISLQPPLERLQDFEVHSLSFIYEIALYVDDRSLFLSLRFMHKSSQRMPRTTGAASYLLRLIIETQHALDLTVFAMFA